MASVHKHPKSRFWTAHFRDSSGKICNRSTKTTIRADAIRIAIELEQAYNQRLTEGRIKELTSELCEKVNNRPMRYETVRAFATRWLALKKPSVAKATFITYEGSIKALLEHLGERGDQDINRLEAADLNAWRDTMLAKAATKTVVNKLKNIGVMLGEAFKDGVLYTDLAKRITYPKVTDGVERRPFTTEELRLILKEADDDWKGIILFGLYTAQRLGDICRMTWRNIDLAKRSVTLTTSKTGRPMLIPLATPLHDWLMERAGDDPKAPIFPKYHKAVETGSVSQMSSAFADLLAQVGLGSGRPENKQGKGVGRKSRRQLNELSFHSLRHTATSYLKEAGVPESVVMDIVGHDSKAMSRHYTTTSDTAKREAVEAMLDITKDEKVTPPESNGMSELIRKLDSRRPRQKEMLKENR